MSSTTVIISYSTAHCFKQRQQMKDYKRFVSWIFAEIVWGRTIEPAIVPQTLTAGNKDTDNDTTLCYTVPKVDTDEHWPQLFKQTLNWTTQEEMVTHLQSSTTKIQPQQRTQQQQLKQQIFSMSCQLFYITKITKLGHKPSSTQEAAWQYFSRRQLMNYVFRKKRDNNLSWKEPTKGTQKLVTLLRNFNRNFKFGRRRTLHSQTDIRCGKHQSAKTEGAPGRHCQKVWPP